MPFCSNYSCLRSSPRPFYHPPIIWLQAISFSSTASHFAKEQTHYETLGVPINATTQQIKKRFYALSLAHHPDRNPKDPKASSKFATISSSYQVLSNTARRARYDRDHQIHAPPPRQTSGPTGSPSASRASFVGSRPASGLSRRRGQFYGPPPSFYAHGGFGHHHHPPPGPDHPRQENQNHHEQRHGAFTGAPFSRDGHIPHFDAASHFRTQSHEDMRRRMRRAKIVEEAKQRAREGGVAVDVGGFDGGSTTARFLMVAGLLVLSMAIANIGSSMEDGSRTRSHARANANANGKGNGSSGADGASSKTSSDASDADNR
ncbi:hypothetical protein FQN57_006672 [Myotisia sp. PD_48]|nr:hypothetical protein FQN57_006672 [Myotisia sp. PD_48]